MKSQEEKIITYLKTVKKSKEKYSIIDFFYLMNEKFGIELPPKHNRLDICREIGMSIYRQGLETYESIDSEDIHSNIYPEHILAKEFFKELL